MKLNHFASVCKAKDVKSVSNTAATNAVRFADEAEDSEDSELDICHLEFTVGNISSLPAPSVGIIVTPSAGTPVKLKAVADSGAMVNVTGSNTLAKLDIDEANVIPLRDDVHLRAAGGKLIPCIGYLDCKFALDSAVVEDILYICPSVDPLLLSCNLCEKL